jgi:drug/metabolite transporter (DMT)-like permease
MTTQGLLLDDSSRLRAIGLMCVAIAMFACLDTTAKYVVTVAGIPLFQAVWLRFVVHGVMNLAVMGPMKFGRALKSAKPGLQLFRGVFLFASTAFNFAALRHLQLDQSVTIFFLTPFLVAVLAGPLLGEWIGWRRMVAVMVGFSGVILVMRPGFGGIHWAVVYSFLSTFSYAFYTISTRYLARYDPSVVTQVYSPIAGIVAMAPLAIPVWIWPADFATWFLLVSIGIWGGCGHYLLILAHRRAPAPVLAPFTYISLIFQMALGYLVFHDLPSAWTLTGGAIIVGSGLYLLHRERVVEPGDGPAAASLSSDVRD